MPRNKQQVDFLELVGQVHHNNLNPLNREIYLHSHYSSGSGDDEGGVEYRMATQFIKNVHLLDSVSNKNILVYLQSPGGDWGHGMAMFDAIKYANSKVIMVAYAEVSSMSSIIIQAAHKRIMMPNSEFMIHQGFLSLDGVATTVLSDALWNKKTDMVMLKAYTNRAINGKFFKEKNMSEEQVLKYIDRKIKKRGNWNLSAEETVFYGFADGIYGDKGFENFDKIRSLK